MITVVYRSKKKQQPKTNYTALRHFSIFYMNLISAPLPCFALLSHHHHISCFTLSNRTILHSLNLYWRFYYQTRFACKSRAKHSKSVQVTCFENVLSLHLHQLQNSFGQSPVHLSFKHLIIHLFSERVLFYAHSTVEQAHIICVSKQCLSFEMQILPCFQAYITLRIVFDVRSRVSKKQTSRNNNNNKNVPN